MSDSQSFSLFAATGESLTLQKLLDLQQLINEQRPTVYYGALDTVARGTVYEICTTMFGSEWYLVLHPDDLPALECMYPGIRFVHLRDKPLRKPAQVLGEM